MPDPQSQANPQEDPLLAPMLKRASSIGPSQIGERYLPTEGPQSLLDLVKQYVLGSSGVPKSVLAQDPYGAEAWMKGAGPTPGLMMGATEEVGGGLSKQLYSRLERAFQSLKEGSTMPAGKAASIAKNAASAEETSWRKLPEFLQSKGQAPVSREDVLAHLEQNPIKVKQTTLGAMPSWSSDDPESITRAAHSYVSKYNQYQEPGGTNYRETLFQLDVPKKPTGGWKLDYQTDGGRQGTLRFDTREQAELRAYDIMNQGHNTVSVSPIAIPVQPTYRSPHFPDHPNTFLHTMSNERELPGVTKTLIEKPEDLVGGKPAYPEEGEFNDEWSFPVPGTGYGIGKGTSNNYSGLGKTEQEAQKDLFNYLARRPEGLPKQYTPGAKGTFLEEVQSDQQHAGRIEGYVTAQDRAANQTKLDQLETEIDRLHTVAENIAGNQHRVEDEWKRANPNNKTPGHVLTPEWSQLHVQYVDTYKEIEQLQNKARSLAQQKHHGVPDIPFKDFDLALKQHLLDVANSPDQSFLGWNTGSTINKRYNLSKYLESLIYDPETKTLDAYDRLGAPVSSLEGLSIEPDKIKDYVGREVADKLLATPLPEKLPGIDRAGLSARPRITESDWNDDFPINYDIYGPTGRRVGTSHGHTPESAITRYLLDNDDETERVHKLSGLDLEVGGAGKKQIYDKMIVGEVNRLLKPFGGKVETQEYPTGRMIETPKHFADYLNDYDDTSGRNPLQRDAGGEARLGIFAPREGGTAEQVATMLPGQPAYHLLDKLHKNLPEAKPETFTGWITHLSPEMKKQISEKGFSLLSALYLVWQHQTGQAKPGEPQPVVGGQTK